MATTTRVLTASVNGTVYTSNANGALEAIDTCHSGATAPTDEVANGKFWLDTSTTPAILKQYNNSVWEVVVNATNVTAAGALMDSEVTNLAQVKAFDTTDYATAAQGTIADSAVQPNDSPTFAGLTVDTDTLYVDSANNRVGIGTILPSADLEIASGNASIKLTDTTDSGYSQIRHNSGTLVFEADEGNTTASSAIRFDIDGTSRMSIDASGNLLVGQTTANYLDTAGSSLRASGFSTHTRDGGAVLVINRLSSDGDIVQFRKDGTIAGVIGCHTLGGAGGGAEIFIGNGSDIGLAFEQFGADRIFPCNGGTGAVRDNKIDLGYSTARFDDIYATNGNIQTSDRNEKQDIASLTPAEMLVAARISTGFKNFKWKDAVAEKGAAARMHSGAIAQDVQDAFTAEGLDAGDYSMFISSTWWTHDVDVPAVEAVAEVVDEHGVVVTEAVEAVAAYTRTDTYDTEAEAPVGAVSKTRLGVRYHELLSFVAAYNEQRFISIETRLAALEP